MRGAEGRRGFLRVMRALRVGLSGAVLAVLAVALAACGASDANPTAVPTFPVAPPADTPSAGPADDGDVIPKDCGRILPAPDLEALFGLPLGSVGLRTTIGVPEPSVGRTERVSCEYTTNAGGARGPILDINITAYRDTDAALAQWRVNADAESGDRRDVPLGAAQAVLFEKPGEAVLMVAHATSNIGLVLPDQPLPGGRSRADMLVDLALRVLPAVTVEPTVAPQPVPQAGAAN
jgi:hypothetical protein